LSRIANTAYSLMAATSLTHPESYRHVCGTLHHIRHTVEFNLLPVTDM